jgi:hypothetical protein
MKNLFKILIFSVLSYAGFAQSTIDLGANEIKINKPLRIDQDSFNAFNIFAPANTTSNFNFSEGGVYKGGFQRADNLLSFYFDGGIYFNFGFPFVGTGITQTGVYTDGIFQSKEMRFTTTNTIQLKPVFADRNGKLVVDNSANHYQSYNFTAVQAQDWDDQLRKGSGFAWFNTTNAPATMYLPVNLPDGVKITNVRMFIRDDSASNLSFTMNRNSHLSNAFTTIATATSASQVSSVFSLNVNTDEIVDNQNNSYYVNISSAGNWTGNTLQFHSLVITYQYQ